MSVGQTHGATGHEHPELGFLRKYIFSEDHKIIGIQFLFSGLIFFLIGGILALLVRIQLAWPNGNVPIVGNWFPPGWGGKMHPDFYAMLFSMHATIMIFFVIIPWLTGAFGNFLIPLMIGARDMAFPKLNMMSYWFMWPAFVTILASFFVEGGAAANGWTSYPTLASAGMPPEGGFNSPAGPHTGPGGGQPLLWQHLFWFYSHPAVYIMILPAMGMVSDIVSTFARKPLFGYKPMVYAIAGIAGLGFIVWGHHMFQSGMDPRLGTGFMVATVMIALPSAVKVFNWLGTMWGGNITFTTPMLNALAFVSMFVIGGLSGIFMAATPVDLFIHDTYFIVAHIHYVLFMSSVFGIFAAIYFWFPKMFGRMMNERWGKWHFGLTFVASNCTFYPMHILGVGGMPRRYAMPADATYLHQIQPINTFISISAYVMGAATLIFVVNFVYSLFFGPR